MKKALIFLLSVTMLLGTGILSVPVAVGASARLGDVDNDGWVTAADARLCLRYAVFLEDLDKESAYAANVDGDEYVSSGDAREILRFSVGLPVDHIKQQPAEDLDYDPNPPTDPPTTPPTEPPSDLNINNSWSNNYYAMFTYYCPAQGYNTATVISERKTDNCFIISKPMDGSFKYYVNSDIGLDEYAVNPDTNLFKYTAYPGKNVSRDINTMFEQISTVDDNFTKSPNVVYTGTETVADRNCWMYLQRTYTQSGEVDKIAYIWIDAVYGFCSKCITYSGGDIVCSWGLQDFSVGTVKDADVTPDLSSYNFTQS